jgi:hypothetical protein
LQRWENPGAEASMNMPEDSEHFDETCTHAERPAVAAWSQNRRRCSAICPAPFAPSHTPRVSHSPRRAAKAPHRSPKPDAGPLTLAAHGLTLLASKPARPALHHRVALALTTAEDRSRAAELGDELKKPRQALREAGRANVSQLVTLCRSSPVRNHGSHFA